MTVQSHTPHRSGSISPRDLSAPAESCSIPSDPAAPNPSVPAAAGPGGEGIQLEPLAAWHLPLLGDPAFVPLHPLLQRAVLLQLPERVLQLLRGGQGHAPHVLLARRGQTPLGLIVSRQVNRSGSCWQVQHLRLAVADQRRDLSKQLLREAILRARNATSWIASSSSLDGDRLAALREQGFQPLRTERLWRWQAPPGASGPPPAEAPAEAPLRALNRRTAWALFQLEQAACPAQLRQLLDRSSDDPLDQSRGRGWMVLDGARNQAVAAVRWLGEHPGGGHDLELTVHPAWAHLVGSGTERLLRQAQQTLGSRDPLWLRSDAHDHNLEGWLQQLGAEPCGERVLMARSVWRRQEMPARAHQAVRRIGAVLEQLQPRRRPMPTPLGPR